ncbi:uncharacterized protein LOC131240758 [Magnolia sinica]|uniref:uncharacterized protein LOC131240758 n=1 Tax=Magnolia sinica TaxID=86752 RepID=UPI002657CCCD|nr:uncharacterized protein LOC131240758 [Magnolia sinica]
METLRKLQQRWKQSPQPALILSICVIFVAVGICATAMTRKKRAHTKQIIIQESNVDETSNKSGWGGIKKALTSSVCWSERSKLVEPESVNLDRMPALLAGVRELEWGRGSPISPLWQRRILMGERCELPRFSGLILYDERGHPLRHHHSEKGAPHHSERAAHQEKPAAVVTTLRDLL